MLLNPIHISQSETDVDVSGINKWASSRDPEGTAARGGEGARTHLCCHMGFIRKGCIFTPCLALHSLLGLKNVGYRERGAGLARRRLPVGREGEVGGKGTRFSALPLRAAGVWWSGPKQSCQGQEGERLKCAQEIAGSKSCRDVRGVACVEKGLSEQSDFVKSDKIASTCIVQSFL